MSRRYQITSRSLVCQKPNNIHHGSCYFSPAYPTMSFGRALRRITPPAAIITVGSSTIADAIPSLGCLQDIGTSLRWNHSFMPRSDQSQCAIRHGRIKTSSPERSRRNFAHNIPNLLFCTLMYIILTLASFGKSVFGQDTVSQLVFPLQSQHVHASSLVELPNGDLLCTWFQGSGERTANDVALQGARLRKGESTWSEVFEMADTWGQPDCNPVLFLNQQNKLFLVWIVVQANSWETSILKYCTSDDYGNEGPPVWNWQDIILLKSGNEFAEEIEQKFKANTKVEMAWAEYAPLYEQMIGKAAREPKKRETGWMTRIHPLILDSGKILLPLYSDGFNLSIIAISEDEGNHWVGSLPIVGKGNIQPSLVQKKDGGILAFMRDSGDQPGRIMMAESRDEGQSWSFAKDSDIPNPGASIEVIKLESGNWLMIYNDTENGRHQLAAAISDNEGGTWKWKKYIENAIGGSYAYPSVIQSKDGNIHLSYSFHLSGDRKSIKYVSFDKDWVKD